MAADIAGNFTAAHGEADQEGPLQVVLVVLLTSSKKVMGKRVNPRVLTWLGWATAAIMAVAAIGMFATM